MSDSEAKPAHQPVPEVDPWDGLSVPERYRSSVGGAAIGPERAAMSSFRNRLLVSDVVGISLALLTGLLVSSRQSTWLIDPLVAIYGTPLAIGLLWMAMLFLRGAYDHRIIGLGPDEFRRTVSATLYTFAVVAGVSYLIRADISRAYAYVSLPLGLALIFVGRLGWRRWLYRRRHEGQFMVRTVVLANKAAGEALKARLSHDAYAGYEVVGQVGLPRGQPDLVALWLDSVDAVLNETEATAVAIDPGDDAGHDTVRQLAWRLEGRGIDLLISPGMLDVAGPRLSVRPAAGLPLLHLDEAALSRPQRMTKRTLDIVGSALGIVLLSPLMIACAIAVKASSPGPVIFRQVRVGRAGENFTMFKFRSMRTEAEAEKDALRDRHHQNGPMFKMARDPRVTRVGRTLRRWSLDELPQLFNVLGGSMSLVGPRPHPLDDVSRYELEAFRRLTLKPGMTGLWQVQGRSDLDWATALKLDLYYVERWSLSTDLLLLARTVEVVLTGKGAR